MIIIASADSQNTKARARKMILAGISMIRFNFSRHSTEKNLKIIQETNEIISELNSKVKTMIDMPIKKIRIGDFDAKIFAVKEGVEIICQSATHSPDCNKFIPINIKKLGEKVHLNQTITIGDGDVAVQVIEIIDQDTIKVGALNNGAIEYMKTFNMPFVDEEYDIVKAYTDILKDIKKTECNYIAISYIDRVTNENIKKTLEKEASGKKIIIKIENQQGITDIDEIVKDKFYDILLIDRGELGVNVPYTQTGIVQKNICQIANKAKKPVIVSTQILESTINNYVPSRAEILDITNMAIDGVYGMMLCRETGINARPAYTIAVARKIIDEVKKAKI